MGGGGKLLGTRIASPFFGFLDTVSGSLSAELTALLSQFPFIKIPHSSLP